MAMKNVGIITARLSTLPNTGGRASSLKMMRRDLSSLWSFLAPTRIVYREENIDYLAGTRCPPIPTSRHPDIREMENCDVILALGSNDLSTPHCASSLYRLIRDNNPQVMIVASGKGGHTTVPEQVFNTTEAKRYEQELLADNVPRKNILTDPFSENTGQNIMNSYALLSRLGLAKKRIAIIQTPAAQLRANLAFEKQWLDQDWEYYVSYPPACPSVKELPDEAVDYHLAYALREIATTLYYMDGPMPDNGRRFVTCLAFPDPILVLLEKYSLALLGEDRDLVQQHQGFRQLFEALEAPYLKP